jgi:hypothetical protein
MDRRDIKERAIEKVLSAFASMGATKVQLEESRIAMEADEGEILYNLDLIGEVDLNERRDNVRYATG